MVPRPSRRLPSYPGVRFFFLGAYPGGRRYILRDSFLSTLRLLSLCRRRRYDAIYARQMDLFAGPALCAHLTGIPLFLEIDDSPVSGNYPVGLQGLVRRKVWADFRQAAGLIVPSLPRCNMLTDYFGIPPQKVHLVLNGTDPLPQPAVDKAAARTRLGSAGRVFLSGVCGLHFLQV